MIQNPRTVHEIATGATADRDSGLARAVAPERLAHDGTMTHGVSFPADADGRRSTTRAGRAVVADALRPVDPVGALGAEQETAWRSGYVLHFRRLVEAGVASPEAWLAIADAGLDAVRRTLVVAADDGSEAPLDSLATAPPRRTLGTVEVLGEARAADRARAALPRAASCAAPTCAPSSTSGWRAG